MQNSSWNIFNILNISFFNKTENPVTVHSTRIPHFPQNSEENLSFVRKPTEDIILVIHKIPRNSAELIKCLGENLEQ